MIVDHAFVPSQSYPEGEGCAYIIDGWDWTAFDPHRCRKSEKEHEHTLRGKSSTPGGVADLMAPVETQAKAALRDSIKAVQGIKT